tara:strand:+ start:729 stop:932 length:204 start_codon:yes stop_codon:yes gene_type:complete
MKLKLEDSIEITINNVKLVIKHNDIGYSIDTYIYEGLYDLDEVLIREQKVYFDDLDEVVESIMLNNK